MEVLLNERRWVLAEEIGTSSWATVSWRARSPASRVSAFLEPRRVFYEREARAFAAELLMPFGEVRRRWFGFSSQGMSVDDIVRRLAAEFGRDTVSYEGAA